MVSLSNHERSRQGFFFACYGVGVTSNVHCVCIAVTSNFFCTFAPPRLAVIKRGMLPRPAG